MSGPALLEAKGLGKRFPGVQALEGVDLALRHGEVLAVIGENGAGKSTLMKILAGIVQPDEGQILLEGAPVRLDSPRHAAAVGIALIHQELNLAGNLSAAANIFLGREKNRWGLIDRAGLDEEAGRHLRRLGLDIDPKTPVDALPIGQQQLVEIAKALSMDARVLIMDEPTSSLSQSECHRLFAVIEDLRRDGVGVIYISHRLGEVKGLADRVTALRDGRNAGDLAGRAIDHEAMVRLMVGRDLSQFYVRTPHAPGLPALEVEGLEVNAWPGMRLDFSVHAGHIVGLAGLVGAGRSELLRCLFGVDAPLAGRILVNGQALPPGQPAAAIAAGVALVPEDRKQQGLVLPMGTTDNIALPGLRQHGRRLGLVDRHRATAEAEAMRQRLDIRTPDLKRAVGLLSGGNQQKVVLGKWLALKPRLLLLDEPTRGIDVGAKEEIYRLMEALAGQGVAILFASSEMEEILGMADRVLVMHEGRISGQLERDRLSEEAVMRLATGQAEAA